MNNNVDNFFVYKDLKMFQFELDLIKINKKKKNGQRTTNLLISVHVIYETVAYS